MKIPLALVFTSHSIMFWNLSVINKLLLTIEIRFGKICISLRDCSLSPPQPSLFLCKTLAVYFALKSMLVNAILLSKYRPEKRFREVVSTCEVYGEKWRISRAQNFSGALRNTQKLSRELCRTVSGPKKFSGLLRNARLVCLAYNNITSNCNFIPSAARLSILASRVSAQERVALSSET